MSASNSTKVDIGGLFASILEVSAARNDLVFKEASYNILRHGNPFLCRINLRNDRTSSIFREF